MLLVTCATPARPADTPAAALRTWAAYDSTAEQLRTEPKAAARSALSLARAAPSESATALRGTASALLALTLAVAVLTSNRAVDRLVFASSTRC